MQSLVTQDKNIEKFWNDQTKVFWLAGEIKVEKDIQDVLVNLTPAEKHGVITTLKLFTLYEMVAGNEYWSNRFKSIFKDRVEFVQLASTFSFFELGVHMPFYKKLNELLHLDNDEFYNSYIKDETLADRMQFIESIIDSRDDLLSLALFSLVEGAVLYSSFAFLKHFQSQGKNKLMNVIRGINFSVRDENIHSMAGAYCFKLLLEERGTSSEELEMLKKKIATAAQKLYEHECRIIEMIFNGERIDGITETQMQNFVQSRINSCLQQLGLDKIYETTYNPIGEWFYDGINGYSHNDFFAGQGSQYHRNWSEDAFIW